MDNLQFSNRRAQVLVGDDGAAFHRGAAGRPHCEGRALHIVEVPARSGASQLRRCFCLNESVNADVWWAAVDKVREATCFLNWK